MSKKLMLLDYDGINLFYRGKWTGIEFKNVSDGRKTVKFLRTLDDEKIIEWIEFTLDKSRKRIWNKNKKALEREDGNKNSR